MPLGYRVFTEIERPSQTLLNRFAGIPTPDLADCMQRAGVVSSAIRPIFRPIDQIIGPAVTISLVDGGFYYVLKVGMELTKPGDVLVIAGRGNTNYAMLGGNLCKGLMNRGVQGSLVDGAVRDLAEIRKLKFPVHARMIAASAGPAAGPGEVNVPVPFGNCVIFPGDIIVADGEGIVAIPTADASAVLAKVAKLQQSRRRLQPILERGEITDIERIRRDLVEDGCEFISGPYRQYGEEAAPEKDAQRR